MNLNELLYLSTDLSLTEPNSELANFCSRLKKFIEDTGRFPSLPTDLSYFSSEEDDVYLIRNCKKFVALENDQNNNFVLPESSDSFTILDELKSAALLAAEIQKIITRKHVPEKGTFSFANRKISIIK